MSKVEYVEIVVKVPKGIMQLFEDYLKFVGSKEYDGTKFLTECCEERIRSYTEEFIGEACGNMFYDGIQEAIEKYGLKEHIDVKAVATVLC